jgi:ribosomal protein L23
LGDKLYTKPAIKITSDANKSLIKAKIAKIFPLLASLDLSDIVASIAGAELNKAINIVARKTNKNALKKVKNNIK